MFSEFYLRRALLAVLLVVLGGIVLHAPLSVGFGVLLPDYSLLIKSWKECLMGVGLVLLVVLAHKNGKVRWLLDDWLVRIVLIYALLHVLMVVLLWNGTQAAAAGLLIDLRYVLYFTLVYCTIRMYPQYRALFLKVALAGAAVVVGFALLQVTVLPIDVLKYIGYSRDTITPYLTVDMNYDFVRINSTLRGPNPLGAYALMVLALAMSFVLIYWRNIRQSRWLLEGVAALAAASTVALWSSHSRSAWLGMALAGLVIIAVLLRSRITRRVWIGGSIVSLAVIGGLLAARDTYFVSNVLLHENPGAGSVTKSNDGHLESLEDGAARMVRQPFGAGVGSTGSPSLLTDRPLIIENQYFYVAHEVGWAGLAVFMVLLVGVWRRLWNNRADWLALGLLASGLGLALIGVLLPVWSDDTVSIVWWGLVAVALAAPVYGAKHKWYTKRRETSNKA